MFPNSPTTTFPFRRRDDVDAARRGGFVRGLITGMVVMTAALGFVLMLIEAGSP